MFEVKSEEGAVSQIREREEEIKKRREREREEEFSVCVVSFQRQAGILSFLHLDSLSFFSFFFFFGGIEGGAR